MNHQSTQSTKSFNAIHAVDATMPTRDSEIPTRTSEIETTIRMLHDSIDALVTRLEPVAQYPVPPGESCKSERAMTYSPLGEKLLSLNEGARSANDRLQEILRRLEV